MSTNEMAKILFLYGSLSLISACSSSNKSDSADAESKFSYFGLLEINDDTSSFDGRTSITVDAEFHEFVPMVTSRIFNYSGLQGYLDLLPLDSCEILSTNTNLDSPTADSITSIFNDLEIELGERPTRFDASAGAPILVRNGNDLMAELTDSSLFDHFTFPIGEYTSDLNLSVEIPGNAVFPAMNVNIPNVEQLILVGSNYLPMSIGNSISWLPDSDNNSHIKLSLSGNFLSDDSLSIIYCKVIDDGEFTVPTNLITQFVDAGVEIPVITIGTISRYKMEIEERTNTSITIVRTSEVGL